MTEKPASSEKQPAKSFDCVRMKREIQERIYSETKDLNPEELLRYFRKRARESAIQVSRSARG